MRRPSTIDAQLANWRRRLAGERLRLIEDQPDAGFYKTRAYSRGPYIGGRIWVVSDIDPYTGELSTDETYQAEIGGRRWDAMQAWLWLSKHPVTVDEYRWLRARAALHRGYSGTRVGL